MNATTLSAAQRFLTLQTRTLTLLAGATLLGPLCTTVRAQVADSSGGVVMDQAWCLRLQKIVDAASDEFKTLRGASKPPRNAPTLTDSSAEKSAAWDATLTWYGTSPCTISRTNLYVFITNEYSCEQLPLQDENALARGYASTVSHVASCLGGDGWQRKETSRTPVPGYTRIYTRFTRTQPEVEVEVSSNSFHSPSTGKNSYGLSATVKGPSGGH